MCKIKPFREIEKIIKDLSGDKSKREFALIYLAGYKKLAEEKKKQSREAKFEFNDEQEEKNVYDIRDKENVSTCQRYIQEYSKYTIEDIGKKALLPIFERFCSIIKKGMDEQKNIDISTREDIKKKIDECINKTKEKTCVQEGNIVEDKKLEERNRDTVNLIKLNDIIYDFLMVCSNDTNEDWDNVDNNESYNRFIIKGKEETFLLNCCYGESAFRIFEEVIEKKVYCLRIVAYEDFEMVILDSMEEAIAIIIECINYNLDRTLDGEGWLDNSIGYDSIEKINLKVKRLLRK